MNTDYLIEQLLNFAKSKGLIGERDQIVARNTLLDLFNLAQPYSGTVPYEDIDLPCKILDALVEKAGAANLFDKDVPSLAVNFEARIMGAVMPRQSEVEEKFNTLYKEKGACAATDYFYALCRETNYIRTAQIANNIKWDYSCKYGNLEITINLTKPEKDPKTIALERLAPSSSYPKCMLCPENIGYAGRINFPARQNHRIVPLNIGNEEWFLQYSPYVYYNEHCIIFDGKHQPMAITEKSIRQIFDFVTLFPHYTCGSNADLPIVGGSILSHMHFQGGKYTFPMQKAKLLRQYQSAQYPSCRFNTINWPVSTLRASGQNKEDLINFATSFLAKWREYSSEGANVFAYTNEEGIKTPHNTVTPILHYNDNEGYILDLVPRNNCTSEEFPEGIFHPHREIHHIKKENIGLIEVMGLAILPSRLKAQCAVIADALTGVISAANAKDTCAEHSDWIDYLVGKYGAANTEPSAAEYIRAEIGVKFELCLEHAGVFKISNEGQAEFAKFLALLGLREI